MCLDSRFLHTSLYWGLHCLHCYTVMEALELVKAWECTNYIKSVLSLAGAQPLETRSQRPGLQETTATGTWKVGHLFNHKLTGTSDYIDLTSTGVCLIWRYNWTFPYKSIYLYECIELKILLQSMQCKMKLKWLHIFNMPKETKRLLFSCVRGFYLIWGCRWNWKSVLRVCDRVQEWNGSSS